jgi:hypothetical protein
MTASDWILPVCVAAVLAPGLAAAVAWLLGLRAAKTPSAPAAAPKVRPSAVMPTAPHPVPSADCPCEVCSLVRARPEVLLTPADAVSIQAGLMNIASGLARVVVQPKEAVTLLGVSRLVVVMFDGATFDNYFQPLLEAKFGKGREVGPFK